MPATPALDWPSGQAGSVGPGASDRAAASCLISKPLDDAPALFPLSEADDPNPAHPARICLQNLELEAGHGLNHLAPGRHAAKFGEQKAADRVGFFLVFGDVEILAHGLLLDHNGELIFEAPAEVTGNNAPTAADLDGDDDLEIIHGRSAYHHDGSVYYLNMQVSAGFPQVADLDDDPEPEIIVNSNAGITILEHDGSIKVQNANPLGGSGFRPSTVHDFDGDDVSEFAVSTAAKYAVYHTIRFCLVHEPANGEKLPDKRLAFWGYH